MVWSFLEMLRQLCLLIIFIVWFGLPWCCYIHVTSCPLPAVRVCLCVFVRAWACVVLMFGLVLHVLPHPRCLLQSESVWVGVWNGLAHRCCAHSACCPRYRSFSRTINFCNAFNRHHNSDIFGLTDGGSNLNSTGDSTRSPFI